MLRARVSHLALATSLACLSACKPTQEPVTPQAASQSAAGVVVGDGEVALVDHPAQMLPRDTQMVGWVAGADRLAEVFERDRLEQKFPEAFQEASREAVAAVGYDFLDPAAYDAVGIDRKGRMGAALISAQGEAAAFFFTLADAGKFKAAARTAAGKHSLSLTETQFGSATLLADPRGEWHGGIIVRDRLAMVVVQGKDDDTRVNYAEAIAKLDPRQSLAAALEYRKALGGIRDTDAMAFVNLGLLINEELARQEAAESANVLYDGLAEAKASGASPAELEEREQQHAQSLRWQQDLARAHAAERALTSTLIDGVEGMGLSLAMKRTGPVLDGQLVLRDDAFLRRMVRSSAPGLALPKALNGEPVVFFGGNVDLDAVLELAELYMQGQGENLHDVAADMEENALGINPMSELVPQLTGEAAVAVTLEAPIDFAHLDELNKQIGLTFHLKIRDPKAVEGLLAKISASKTPAGAALTKKGGGYAFAVPKFRDMQAVVAGENLLVTTDAGLAGRLATGVEGSMRRDSRPPGPYYVMTLPNVGAAWTTHLGYMATFFLGVSSVRFDAISELEGAPNWEAVERTKISRAAKKKQVERDAARARLDAAQTAADGAQAKVTADAVQALGSTAFVLQPNTRGFSIAGGQFIGVPTLGGVVESLLTLDDRNLSRPDTSAVDAARKQYEQIERDYRALRIQDWERANKGARKQPTTKAGG